MSVKRRMMRKAARVIMIPVMPLVRRLLAAWMRLGSPELVMYSLAAIMMLARKRRPIKKKTRVRMFTLPPVRIPAMLRLASGSGRLVAGLMFLMLMLSRTPWGT